MVDKLRFQKCVSKCCIFKWLSSQNAVMEQKEEERFGLRNQDYGSRKPLFTTHRGDHWETIMLHGGFGKWHLCRTLEKHICQWFLLTLNHKNCLKMLFFSRLWYVIKKTFCEGSCSWHNVSMSVMINILKWEFFLLTLQNSRPVKNSLPCRASIIWWRTSWWTEVQNRLQSFFTRRRDSTRQPSESSLERGDQKWGLAP